MKPIFLMTVFRRYHEFVKNLENLINLAKKELGIDNPEIIVVWAQPEIGRIHLFKKLLAEGKIKRVLGRPKLDGEEGISTTFPESYNIRYGLSYLKEKYESDITVIFMTADIYIQEDTLTFLKNKFNDGNRAVLFHWPNGFVQSNIWHTNFFMIPIDEKYWPPLANKDEQDVLEWKWGKDLAEKNLTDVFRWHNYNNRKFIHSHDSEQMEKFQEIGFDSVGGVELLIKTRKRWGFF